LVVFFYGKLSKLSIWFESLLKNDLLGVKLGIRLIFGVIIQFFVCGSKFRARWHVWMKDSYGT
jgi:hypothetical protein